MRHDQGTGTDPYWSAADFSQLDWQATADRLLKDTPTWVLLTAAGVVLITVVITGSLAMSRASKRKTERDQRHRDAVAFAREKEKPLPPEPLHMDAKPLIGGILVSLNGLWGFAQDTVQLSFLFAVGFVSMFDVLEMKLFSDMYKMANAEPRRRWTRQLKLMRLTAWGFVFTSAGANIVHAPNPWAAPFLAIMPIGAAWVIYVPLQNALAGEEEEDDTRREGTKPGPFRLAGLLWRRLWAWCFRKAGLDVTDRADEMVRRARARDAADASYELRKALVEKEKLEKAVGGADLPRGRGKVSPEQKRLDTLNRELETKIRPKAQGALEMADTQDPEQGLQLMQRMAWLTRADDVAMLDYGPDSRAMTVLEELNIAANAEFVKSNRRAIEAGEKATAAAETQLKAERAVKEATDKLTAVEEELEQTRKAVKESLDQAADEREKEEKRLKSLREERIRLESSDASAGQLYQRTVRELEDTRQQLTTLMEERGKLTEATSGVQADAALAQKEVVRLEGVQRALEERLGAVADERDRLTTAASDAQKEAREAREQVLRLEERLASIERLQAAGVPARAHPRDRIDARVGSGGADTTRQRVRDLLNELSPQDRQQSQRKVAAQLMDKVGLSLDGVRIHLRAIEQEDAEAAGVPAPREQEDPERAFEDHKG